MDCFPIFSRREIAAVLQTIRNEDEKVAFYQKIETAALKNFGFVDKSLLDGIIKDMRGSNHIACPSSKLLHTTFRVLQSLIRKYPMPLDDDFIHDLLWSVKHQSAPETLEQATETLAEACSTTKDAVRRIDLNRFIKSATTDEPETTPHALQQKTNTRAILAVVADVNADIQDKIFDRLWALSSNETFQTYQAMFSFKRRGGRFASFRAEHVSKALERCLSFASCAPSDQGIFAHNAAKAIMAAYLDVTRAVADKIQSSIGDHAESAVKIRALSIIQTETENEKYSVVSPAMHRKIARFAREAKDLRVKEAAYQYWAAIPAPFRLSMLKEMSVVLSYDAIKHPDQMVRVAATQCIYRVRDDDYGCPAVVDPVHDPRQPLYSALVPYLTLPMDRKDQRGAEILYTRLRNKDVERKVQMQECARIRRAVAYLDRLAL